MSEVGRSKRKLSLGEELTPEEKARQTIQTAKKELDSAIQQLDMKIQKRIQANECKFLIAYKNHLDKITRQLKVLKQNYDVHEKKFESDKAIVALGKQCTLFRQEAMRLHSQLEDAITEADIYKRKSEILQKQVINTNELLKKSIHSNKILEAQRLRLVLQISRKDKQISTINEKLSTGQKNNESVVNEQKIPQQKSFKTSQQDMRIKIPEVLEPPHVKIKDWLNITGSIRILSPQTQRNQETEYNYKVFEREGNYNFNSRTPKNRSIKGTQRKRNLTCSTLQYQSSYRQPSMNQNQLDSGKNMKSNHKLEESQCKQNGANEEENFNKFLHSVKNARARVAKHNCHDSYNLKSSNLNDLIANDIDILELCRKLFPNLNINANFEVNLENSRTTKTGLKLKTVTQLSAELMQKFNIEKMGKMGKIKTQNSLHLSPRELEYINKNKDHIKTEVPDKDNKISKLAAERASKLKKMNDSFKRKTLPNQSAIYSFYLSARTQGKKA